MNSTKAEGVLDQAKGKVKQAVGETFNNQKLANFPCARRLVHQKQLCQIRLIPEIDLGKLQKSCRSCI